MSGDGYLCSTRRLGEKILVGDGIEILITKIRMNQVVVCVKAPGLEIRRPTKEQDALDREEWFRRRTED